MVISIYQLRACLKITSFLKVTLTQSDNLTGMSSTGAGNPPIVKKEGEEQRQTLYEEQEPRDKDRG